MAWHDPLPSQTRLASAEFTIWSASKAPVCKCSFSLATNFAAGFCDDLGARQMNLVLFLCMHQQECQITLTRTQIRNNGTASPATCVHIHGDDPSSGPLSTSVLILCASISCNGFSLPASIQKELLRATQPL